MQSMTGFGRGTAESPLGRLSVELRTLNHRFTELSLQLPASLGFLDQPARRRVAGAVQRGKVTLLVRFEPGASAPAGVALNRPLLEELASQARAMRDGGPILPEVLMLAPGVVSPAADPAAEEGLLALFDSAFDGAAKALRTDRAREGAVLAGVFAASAARMRAAAHSVGAGAPHVVSRYRDKLKARLEELLGASAGTLDPGRIEQEVVLFADKADISEELVRLDAHLDALGRVIADDSAPVGRKLDFLAQEIGREVNTIGSKCRDLDLARHVLDLKAELEILKEQIANVE